MHEINMLFMFRSYLYSCYVVLFNIVIAIDLYYFCYLIVIQCVSFKVGHELRPQLSTCLYK